jgi:uncharacterized membrane protein YgcG
MRGNDIVRTLAAEKARLENELNEVDREVEAFRRERNDLEEHRREAVDQVASALVASGSSALPSRYRDALVERERAADRLRAGLSSREAATATLARTVETASSAYETVNRQHRERAGAIEEVLGKDPAYVSARGAQAELDKAVSSVQTRLKSVQEDVEAKKAEYESDDLFVYLRKRKFGTADYSAFWPFNNLDAMLARAIGYGEASADYDRMIRIPAWFDSHLEDLRSRQSAAASVVDRMRTQALDPIQGLEKDLQRSRRTLDDALSAHERHVSSLENDRRSLLSSQTGEDEGLRQIVRDLADELLKGGIDRVLKMAVASGVDQDVMAEIRRIHARLGSMIGEVRSSNERRRTIAERHERAATLESRMRSKGWTSNDDHFDRIQDGAIASVILSQISVDDFLRTAQGSHRSTEVVASSPDSGYGTGGSISSSGSRSTGGGFGGDGGGYSTGGSFGGDSAPTSSDTTSSNSSTNDTGGGF